MMPWIRITVIAASCALLVWEAATGGYWLAAPWIALIGVLWIFIGTRWGPFGYVGLMAVVLAAGAGEILHLAPIPLLLALTFALAAWDLDHFSRRLALAAKQDDIAGLERNHLSRLGLVLLVGVALSLAAIVARGLSLSFEISGGLALLAAWGLTYLVIRLRRAA